MTFEQIAILGAWALLVVLLVLIARSLRHLRSAVDEATAYERPRIALTAGAAAPEFRARLLEGGAFSRDDLDGAETLLLFVSPACGTCRREMRGFVSLGRTARQRTGISVVLVSDQREEPTEKWIAAMREVDGVTVDLPVAIAPYSASSLTTLYNPPRMTPSYCVVAGDLTVRSAGKVGSAQWSELRVEWEGAGARRNYAARAGRRG